MFNFNRSIVVAIIGLACAVFAYSDQDTHQGDELFDLSIEELMQVPVTVSSGRVELPLNMASARTSVITSQDIHYSGLTSIPELLQYVPGLDVMRVDRRRYAVGVRGLHESFSDRLKLLINGRAADNPIFGGPDFGRLQVMVEDIERIEIVKGPVGGAWGANAFTGVINIITKSPADTQGVLATTTINEVGDSYSQIRYGDIIDRLTYRVSVGYEDFKSSEDAIDGTAKYYSTDTALADALGGFSSYVARDFERNFKIDSVAEYKIDDYTSIDFGFGYKHIEGGDWEIIGFFPSFKLGKDLNTRDDYYRWFVKLNHEFEDGDKGWLQFYQNIWNANWPSSSIYNTIESVIETQYDFEYFENHKTSIGASIQWTHIETETTHQQTADVSDDSQNVYPGAPFLEHWIGGYIIDRWQISDRWTLEGQLRVDEYSKTQTDWAGRLALLHSLDEEKDHILRFSAARAYRTPFSILREMQVDYLYNGAASAFFVNILKPTKDLSNESTWSFEIGYDGKLSDNLQLRVDGYYQVFNDLIKYNLSMTPAITYTPQNSDENIHSFGIETEMAYADTWGKFSVWYAHNNYDYQKERQNLRSALPAVHKFGSTLRLFLDDKWTFNSNFRLISKTEGNPYDEDTFSSRERLDLSLSKEIFDGSGELMFGVQNVTNKTEDFYSESSANAGHETPGRTFFARAQFKF